MGPYGYGYPSPPSNPWEGACVERPRGLPHEKAYRDGRPYCVYCGCNPEAPWPNPDRLDLANLPPMIHEP